MHTRSEPIRSVLIVDDHHAFCTTFAHSFRALGFAVRVQACFASARAIVQEHGPEVLVTEIRVGCRWAFDFIEEVGVLAPGCCKAVVTAYPSVATATRATQLGVNVYLPKPVTAEQVLSRMTGEPTESGAPPRTEWPTLDRTIWEYLNQAVVVAGSISEAARRLGFDKRSLRRLLGKYPPTR